MVILVGDGAAFYFDGWIYCCTEIMSCCSRRFFVAFIYTVAGQRAAFWPCLGVHSAVCVCVCGCVCVCVCVCGLWGLNLRPPHIALAQTLRSQAAN